MAKNLRYIIFGPQGKKYNNNKKNYITQGNFFYFNFIYFFNLCFQFSLVSIINSFLVSVYLVYILVLVNSGLQKLMF